MSKIQSNVQKAKEHERNLTSSTDALGREQAWTMTGRQPAIQIVRCRRFMVNSRVNPGILSAL